MTFPDRKFFPSARGFERFGLCCACSVSMLLAQQPAAIEPVPPSGPAIVRPYLAGDVPPARLGNAASLSRYLRAGTLYLTAQDAIALALANNIDIEVARYNPILAAWELERSQAGGALPGVPSGAAQVGSVANGQGVAGSQAAAGVSTGGGTRGSASGNATISQIGPITQTLDPTIQESTVFSHQTVPQQNNTQSATPVLISKTRVFSTTYQQGFLSGGNVNVGFKNSYLNENAPTDVLNPSSAPSLSITFQQNFLRGFGIGVNARTIRVSQLNVQESNLNFKTQVINTISDVLNLYYALVADDEDLRAKRSAVDVAQQLVNNTIRQQQAGVMAQLDVTTAEAGLASAQNDLVVSETTYDGNELQLKNEMSRNGIADPVLASARIVPLDRITVPETNTLPPLDQMVKTALDNRSDLAAQKLGVTGAEISALGTRNGLLPSLQVTGAESDAGLAGNPRVVVRGTHTQTADAYFAGGIGNALGQLLRRNFPTNRATVFFQAPIGNRQAQADYAVDQLQLRQTQLAMNESLNSVTVAISNYAVALQQAEARYQAAAHTVTLDQQLLSAEQKKLAEGLSTPYNVVVQEQQLAAGQSTELAALVAYSNARLALDQTLGTTLEVNHVSLDQARSGVVPEPPPATPAPPQR